MDLSRCKNGRSMHTETSSLRKSKISNEDLVDQRQTGEA